MRGRIALYYLVYYGGLGAAFPFLTLYLHARGISAVVIGMLMAANALAGMVAQPWLGALSDKARDARTVLMVSALLSPVALAGYVAAHRGWLLWVTAVVTAVLQSASGPIFDAIAVRAGEEHGFSFGQARLWGALGFAVSTVIAGYAYGRFGYAHLFWVYAVFSLASAAVLLAFPPQPRRAGMPILSGVREVAGDARFLGFTSICFLLSLTSAVNFSFFGLYYQALHYPLTGLGANFSVAAVVEIPFFYISGWLQARFGRPAVLCFGAGMYAVKYAVVAAAPPLWVLLAVQALDGVGFALTNSASVEMVNALVPARWKATGQTAFAALSSGLSNIVGTAAGGLVMAAAGPQWLYGALAAAAAAAALGFVAFGRWSGERLNTAPE
ncbi:3-phenylpropionic acid transporter [Alicyclobacillus cellulosilyticus]|uniref:3-phenylpropionic acid transporter n=1 Tax=Alicyclobacillus cellulosilyticus TaxID=1003997 RepID=A0A917K7Y1_9BACL|nr:MFS transporter [Alicyclobacillus cellulosilyticus]GGJ02116.1 3-phenylpropionic acid transporter [Alicyclobacillus cellulosilyticus]